MIAGDEGTGNKNGKPSTLFFSLYYHYFHSLLTALTNALPPKHCPKWGLVADHSGIV